jgi:thiol-disulfide isomerase/thioredoxin
MRTFFAAPAVLVASFFYGSFHVQAQTALSLPGCEASPEVRKTLDEKLDYSELDKMKYTEQHAFERQVLEDLVAKYPRELEPSETLGSRIHQYFPDEYPAFRDRRIKAAKDNPNDPLALLLGGEALAGKDTPETIRLWEAAKAKAPSFPWPALKLAGLYADGKRADPVKMKENIEAFFASCPASTDGYAQWLLMKDPALQPKVGKAVAVAARARLEKETDPKKLRDYGSLWGKEFRLLQPKEYDAERTKVAQDLKRLEALNPHGDAEWQAFLIKGYKQSGASKETLTAMEDRLISEYPHSDQAENIVSKRWNSDHKEPEDQSDAAAWTKYYQLDEETEKAWIRDYPDDRYLQRFGWFEEIRSDDTITEKEAIAALEAYQQAVKDYRGSGMYWYYYHNIADYLLGHGWQPARALDLVKQAQAELAKARARDQDNDNLSDKELKDRKDWQIKQDLDFNGLLLKAALQAGLPDEALKLRSCVEAPLPEDKKLLSGYWLNRARFEAVQKHGQDALTYYELALQTRSEAPKAYHGRLRDDVIDESHALWKTQGGTEAAWAVWSKPSAAAPEQLAEGRWEKPTKTLPVFELSDMSGKIWRLKDLDGKTLLINVWATWCGPCQTELPHLQKFYEKIKGRTDIQILTFDVDANPGLLGPFLKEKGFTFPVLSAYTLEATNGGIPQNWIVDPHGSWKWTQLGYRPGSDADFEKEMLEKLESVKVGK